MARIEAYTPGQFSWVDLMSPDAQVSTRFYESLFGWSHQAQQDQHGAIYTMFTRGGLNVCGMGEMSPELKQAGMPPVWNSYVTVEDAAATVARCRDLGGRVQMDVIPITDAGKMAILVDPAGAHISVWEPGAHIGA
jgi:predicted enzyme related to lactoylglutathione lyase